MHIHHHLSVMKWQAARVLGPGDHLPLSVGGPASGHLRRPHFHLLAILRHVQCGPGALPYLTSELSGSLTSWCWSLPAVFHFPRGLWGAQYLQPDLRVPRGKYSSPPHSPGAQEWHLRASPAGQFTLSALSPSLGDQPGWTLGCRGIG